MTEIPTISAFTGLGGLDLGLECAGFTLLGYLETDETARQSLAENRPQWNALVPAEVNQASKVLTPKGFGLDQGELGMIVGAPPCQPFSKAAQWAHNAMKGLRDRRAACLSGFMRLAECFLPRVILMENVEGYVRGKTSALAEVNRHLGRINKKFHCRYRLQHWIVDAADYGVPQHRRRAILFAERNGAELRFPTPQFRESRITAWDALRGLPDPAPCHALRNWLELLPSIPEGWNYHWHTERGGGWPLFGYRTRFWSFLLKLAKDKPSWTLPAQPGPYTGPFHWTNRALTPTEMLRLQSFPEDWHVSGTLRQQVRQIGNATPPLLAEVIGRQILRQVFGAPKRSRLRLSIRRAPSACPEAETVSRVPRKFRIMCGDWPEHPGTGRGPMPIRISR